MILYVIRHGSPDYENDSLTELGIKQAEALGVRMEKIGIDRVFSSPNGRARKTAEPTCRRLVLEMKIEDWLSENLNAALAFNDGRREYWYTDEPVENVKNEETLSYGDNWYEAPVYVGLEDPKRRYEEIMRESDRLCEELGYKREGKVYRVLRKNEEKVAVFCHSCTGVTWTAYLLGISPALFGSCFDYDTTGVTKLDFGDKEAGEITAPFCGYFSDTSHKYEAKLP